MNSIIDIIYQPYPIDTYMQFYEVLIISFSTGFNINLYLSKDKGIEFYIQKILLHIVLMKLAKNMNVWILLSICFGHGARYVFDKEMDLFVKKILNNLNAMNS